MPDNLQAHERIEARRAIESGGAQLVLLLPYSPDLTAIEIAVSKIRANLRRQEHQTIAEVEEAIGECPNWFSRKQCRNFLRHCGYHTLRRKAKCSNTQNESAQATIRRATLESALSCCGLWRWRQCEWRNRDSACGHDFLETRWIMGWTMTRLQWRRQQFQRIPPSSLQQFSNRRRCAEGSGRAFGLEPERVRRSCRGGRRGSRRVRPSS